MAVISLAFHDAVRDRFSADPSREQVAAFAAKVSKYSGSERVTPSAVEPVVLRAIEGSSGPLEDLDGRALEVMIWAFARIVDDLAFYDYELDALLVAAEQAAQALGCTLISPGEPRGGAH